MLVLVLLFVANYNEQIKGLMKMLKINDAPILEQVMLKSNYKTPFIQKPVNSFFSFTETSYVKNQPIFSKVATGIKP